MGYRTPGRLNCQMTSPPIPWLNFSAAIENAPVLANRRILAKAALGGVIHRFRGGSKCANWAPDPGGAAIVAGLGNCTPAVARSGTLCLTRTKHRSSLTWNARHRNRSNIGLD